MQGRLFWITGLSGAGKTTIGKRLYDYIKENKENVILLDGDILREVYKDQDYSLEGRKNNALRTCRLCKLLTEQGMDVVVCIIAMFEECREWNRKNISNYEEIYLKVSIDELIRRDQKQLYSKALKHEISNVMGIDLNFDEPDFPSLVIENEGASTPEYTLEKIKEKFLLN